MADVRPVAVVSGASGGIGMAVARLLYSKSHHLLLLTGSKESADALRKDAKNWPNPYEFFFCAPPPPGITVIAADLRMHTVDLCYRLLPYIEPYKRVNLLVTCHGAEPLTKPTLELKEEEWWRVIDIDVAGTFRLVQAIAPFLIQPQVYPRVIIFMSSIHAQGTYPQRAPYAMAKTAITGLTRALACEWAGKGVRINAIAPGQVLNERTAKLADETIIADMRARSPAGRLVTPVEVAQAVYAVYDQMTAMNGQTLFVDHGVTASLWHGNY